MKSGNGSNIPKSTNLPYHIYYNMSTPTQNIRNFCIIAHIDHGKSTLADRFLELTHTVTEREMKEQLLDQMELEREKGITIKLAPARMKYQMESKITNNKSQINPKSQIPNNKTFILNLIDTPGHVDFTYEVSRSLAAVEGAILLVDATQGIQAQTLSNLYLALEQNLAIIPVINKIDLPNADIKKTKAEIVSLLGVKESEILEVSAKTGANVEKVLDKIVQQVPPPKNSSNENLQALIFDSSFDEYKGVIAYVRIFNGEVKTGDTVKYFATGKQSEVLEAGTFSPKMVKQKNLATGEIGYIVTGLKELDSCKVGDTVTKPEIINHKSEIKNFDQQPNCLQSKKLKIEPLPGYKEIKPMVFAGIYCKEGSEFAKLREALLKLKLTDAALTFEPENSPALGFGFRCGFLGLLHLEIIQERLRREYNLELIVTTPSVAYKVKLKNNKETTIHSPQELPDQNEYESISEPWMKIDIITPEEYLGSIMKLAQTRSGIYKTTEYLSQGQSQRVILHYEIPLSFLLTDFYDKLKSVSSGYASLNYEFLGYREAEVQKIDILVAEEKVQALTTIVYKKRAYSEARSIVEKLKDSIPRQMFEVKIQAVTGYQDGQGKNAGGKVIASERISAMRKDVTAKLYGGDVTRKQKLLEKQKKGKKKMKGLGRVDIPTEAYLAVLKK